MQHAPDHVRAALLEAFPDGLPPPTFDARYKNPCWQRADKSLACVPYAYIAGFLKCASTAVHALLVRHPAVQDNMLKETHWWSRYRRPFGPSSFSLDRKFEPQTLALATSAHPHEAVFVDGSVSMFWETNYGGVLTPELVRAVTPAARFILMVRDPVDRLFSDYLYFAYHTKYDEGDERDVYTYDAAGFHRAATQSVAAMRECLAQHPALVCATAQRQFRTKTQIHIGMYACFFDLWFAFFPREQFLVLRQEDLGHNTRAMADAVTAHLRLAPLPDSALAAAAGERPNALRYRGEGMWPQTRRLLNEFYAPFNEQLAAMFNNTEFNYHKRSAP